MTNLAYPLVKLMPTINLWHAHIILSRKILKKIGAIVIINNLFHKIFLKTWYVHAVR